MRLFLIDGIGPFFRGMPDRRTNWSKIPFAHLEQDGQLEAPRWDGLVAEFARFCRRAAEAGYNAISLDDLAHLAPHPAYGPDVQKKLAAYAIQYERLFSAAEAHGLGVYLTTDVMYFTPALEAALGDDRGRIAAFLAERIDEAFARHPALRGIILRIGEEDGRDVHGDFRSRLTLRTPAHVQALLKTLLPVFERHGRDLVFRTWAVGAYRIGDLIWNRDTFSAAFDGIASERLVISMKYGESDFFRHLPLNRHFFSCPHRTLIELQARREYEGAGQYPSFTGGDYAAFRDLLAAAPRLDGIMVWVQTGGWTRFKRLSYLDPEGVWNELNAEVTLLLFRDGLSVEGAVRRVFQQRWGAGRWDHLLELLTLSEQVVKELLYTEEFARRKLFFRRLRVPPLLTVFWDQIVVSEALRKLMRCFVLDRPRCLHQADDAMAKLDRMVDLAGVLGLPVKDVAFQRDTFALLAQVRRYFLGEDASPAVLDALHREAERYYLLHQPHYTVVIDRAPMRLSRSRLKRVLYVLFREQRGYRRILDRVFTIRLLVWMLPLLRFRRWGGLPDFAHEDAMGVDTILR